MRRVLSFAVLLLAWRAGAVRLHLAVALAVAAAAATAQATPIRSRAGLEARLVEGTLEDFEALVFEDQVQLSCSLLDATAICNSQGPGLVVPGVSFAGGDSILQWNGAGYYGSPSKEILARNPMVIDFSAPVQAFGVDLRAFSGFADTATMTVFAADDVTPIGSITSIALPGTGVPVFAGWQDSGGIGRVELTQPTYPWSPIIDNLEFGIVPEPSTGLLVMTGLLGLAARRKRLA